MEDGIITAITAPGQALGPEGTEDYRSQSRRSGPILEGLAER